MKKTYFVLTIQGDIGPVDREGLRQLLDEGRIQPGDQVRTAFGSMLGPVAEVLRRRPSGEQHVPPGAALAVAPPGPTGRPRPSRMLLLLGLGAGLLFAIALVVVLSRSPGPPPAVPSASRAQPQPAARPGPPPVTPSVTRAPPQPAASPAQPGPAQPPSPLPVRPAGGTPVPPSRVLWLEAEGAGSLTAPLAILADTTAAGGSYIANLKAGNSYDQPPATGHAVYTFALAQAGAYVIWGRVLMPSANKDSFWVRVDDGPWTIWSGTVSKTWTWREFHVAGVTTVYELAAGTHTLTIAYREDGAKLDALYIANDGSVPSGMSPATRAR